MSTLYLIYYQNKLIKEGYYNIEKIDKNMSLIIKDLKEIINNTNKLLDDENERIKNQTYAKEGYKFLNKTY